MHVRELAIDLGWLALIVLLIPLAIPLGALAFVCLLGQRLYAWTQGRMGPGFAGGPVARRITTSPTRDASAPSRDELVSLTGSAMLRNGRGVGALLDPRRSAIRARRG